jgi:hypothetical protein
MSDTSDQGEITLDELQQIKGVDEIGERYYEHFKPDYDSIPDDDSSAESGDVGE